MWLPWEDAAIIGIVLAAAGLATRRMRHRVLDALRPFLWESVLLFELYALWQWGQRFNLMEPDQALARGHQVWTAQRWLHLPSEVSLQNLVLPHGWIVQASNLYYAGAHVPALIALLVWLFARHRDVYRPIRNVLAITTAISLGMHLVPVAPPRMFPQLGFVDTALRYGQSVYGPAGTGVSDQVGAMPSVHVLWATLVALGVWLALRRTGSPWRWLGVVHLALTVLAVTDTANHWWLDGILAAALIPPAWWLQATVIRRLRTIDPIVAPQREVDRVP
jgi:hypothetical protein